MIFNRQLRQAGVSLIEVLVTLLIVSMGMLGLSSLQSNAIKVNFDASQRSQVTWIVNEMAERMRANPTGLGFYQAAALASAAAAPPCNVPVTVCSDNPTGDMAGVCTAQEQANYDVAEVYCGHNIAGVYTDSADTIALTSMTIAPVNLAVTVGGVVQVYYNITLRWQSKIVGDLNAAGARVEQQQQQIVYTFLP